MTKYETTTRFVSVMVPLNTGQSKNVVIQATPYNDALCESCRKNGCVVMPTGQRCIVVECPDCALDGWFSDSYGYIINESIGVDELIRNEAKYALSPSSWLSAYIDGTLSNTILFRDHNTNQITDAMELLMEMTYSYNYDEKCNRSSSETYSEPSTPNLASLHITSPKLLSKARRHLDITRQLEDLFIGEPATSTINASHNIVSSYCHQNKRQKLQM